MAQLTVHSHARPAGRARVASTRNSMLALVCLTALAVLGMACEENPVGRKCIITSLDDGTGAQTVISSPALECQSRICLRVPQDRNELPEGSEYSSLCTAECSTDEDCDRVPESPCQTGFTCAVPVVAGPFCCRKLCVCKDYLPEGGIEEPASCDASDQRNTCCNLPGREGDPACQ